MLRIKVSKELPQWIINSDRAAYCPTNNTIYIRRDLLFTRSLFHELGHWLGHKIGGHGHWLHAWLDGGTSSYRKYKRPKDFANECPPYSR